MARGRKSFTNPPISISISNTVNSATSHIKAWGNSAMLLLLLLLLFK